MSKFTETAIDAYHLRKANNEASERERLTRRTEECRKLFANFFGEDMAALATFQDGEAVIDGIRLRYLTSEGYRYFVAVANCPHCGAACVSGDILQGQAWVEVGYIMEKGFKPAPGTHFCPEQRKQVPESTPEARLLAAIRELIDERLSS